MKIIQLSQGERASSGFTHKANISYANGDFSEAATTQTYTLASLAVGDLVRNCALRKVTDLSGGSVSAAVALVGKTGTTNAYCTSSNVFTSSTVHYKAGDGASFNQAGGEVHIATSALIVTITTTTANVSTLTAGEIDVYFSICTLSNL